MFFINSHSFSTYTVNIFSQLYSLDADTFSFISSKCMNVFYKSEKMLYKQLMLDCVGGGVEQDNLVFSTELMMQIGHHKEVQC